MKLLKREKEREMSSKDQWQFTWIKKWKKEIWRSFLSDDSDNFFQRKKENSKENDENCFNYSHFSEQKKYRKK